MHIATRISLTFLLPVLLSCNDSNTTATTPSPTQDTPEEQTATASSDNGIVGKWKLTLEAVDANGNKKLEDDERKKGFRNNYLLDLKADGSCRIQQIYAGRYEVKEEKGIKMLYVYRKKVEGEEKQDPVPDVYEIRSQTATELILIVVIATMSTDTFWIFNKA